MLELIGLVGKMVDTLADEDVYGGYGDCDVTGLVGKTVVLLLVGRGNGVRDSMLDVTGWVGKAVLLLLVDENGYGVRDAMLDVMGDVGRSVELLPDGTE